MTTHDAACLLAEIRKTMDGNFKLSEKDASVCKNIVARMKRRQPLSDAQAWALLELYRRSQGHYNRLYSRIV
jgi:hypothetical protein